ncbi:unnamed protein product, partial [marine sediment metagenome]
LNGSVPVDIQTHMYSSGECFKYSPHLHAWVLPLKMECDKVENVDGNIFKADLESIKKGWARIVKEISTKHGYEGVDRIPDKLVVHAVYIPVLENLKKFEKPSMNLRYDYRSPVQDLMKAVMCADFKGNTLIMAFSLNENFGYYAVWKIEDFIRLAKEKLSKKRTRTTYGWFRRLEKHASILGIEVEKEKDDFEPIPEITVNTVFKRVWKNTYNKEKGRLERRKQLFVKALNDGEKPESWEEVDPYQVKGETVFFGNKKVFNYKVLCRFRE